MTVDVTELMKQKEDIDYLQKRIDTDSDKLAKMKAKLHRECPHHTTTTKSKYYEGGYDYVSSVMITVKCALCDKVVKSYEDKNHKGTHA